MSRALTVLMTAGVMVASAQTAAAQYYGPVDYYDAPPRYYEERYDRYGPPRGYYDEREYYGEPDYYEERPPFIPERRYRDRPRYGEPYGYRRPRYDYDDDPVYDEDFRDEDLPERRRFDPRRPHLGDGTDAPTEQYYPRRPRSCGEYYYWDGSACVDARHYPPYVGPKL
ncbi:hypothetical protein [Dichotomicrobium thermohalophilum]|uniref:PXPV repeat-containing protein n=1 Tax=Dichotomicrobium thermohalophilum TaxID=933063 RepID=A0A397Q9N5_9HYPH|nr:hypothetical protein [Dichotomicrobium thermohalophilum]RIA56227.1 hypothetical protein BXY53_1329 [Dichotomicrobium thermohalophilum]